VVKERGSDNRADSFGSAARDSGYLPLVTANLLPSERIIWAASPARFPVFDATDLVMVPFSLVWCGFMVFWEVQVFAMNGPTFFKLWGLLFLVAGLYLVAGRLVVRWLTLRGTVYTVTNRRIIVATTTLGFSRENSRYLDRLDPPVLKESANGVGTIRFGSTDLLARLTAARAWNLGRTRPIELREIASASYVRDLIASARAE